MEDMHTPDDVLERTYRRALEQADALGITFDELLPMMLIETADELRQYTKRVYG